MPRKKNSEETIKQILDVSFTLFKTKGYENTSVIDIVSKMGVSRGAFYHHFTSKEDVLYALLESKRNKEIEHKVYNDPTITPLQRIRMLLFYTGIELNHEDVYEEMILFNMWLDLLVDSRVMAEHLKECQEEDVSWLVPLLEDAIEKKEIKKQNPVLLAELILLLLNFWTIPTIYPVKNIKMFEEKIQLAKDVLDNIGCPLVNETVIEAFKTMANNYQKNQE